MQGVFGEKKHLEVWILLVLLVLDVKILQLVLSQFVHTALLW
jgi:hypothetical protein